MKTERDIVIKISLKNSQYLWKHKSLRIGDVMDMRDIETHYLTQLGLQNLQNPFIAGMAKKNEFSLGDTLSPIGVAFYIVPLINSVTRVGTMEEKTVLFESMLEWKAHELIPSTKRGHKGEQEERIEQSLRICTNVKNRQSKEQDSAVSQIENIIDTEFLYEHKVLVIRVQDNQYNKAITGLIANKIMGQYCQPVILVSKDIEGNWTGSIRGCGIDNFKDILEESGLILWCQGHQNAAGISFKDENYQLLVDYLDHRLKDVVFSTSYKIDFIFNQNTLKSQTITDIDNFKYLWGQGVEEPLIMVEGIKITKDMLTLMARDRNPTLKIQIGDIVAIKFKSSEEELKMLESEGYTTINIIAKCQVNKYYDRITPQLIIQEYEIIDTQKFYF